MFAIVKYKDNSMYDFDIVVKSEELLLLEDLLHDIRKSYYGEKNKPVFRIIRLSQNKK